MSKDLSVGTILTPLNNTYKTHLNPYNMIEELIDAFQKGSTLYDRDDLLNKMKECLEERKKDIEKRAQTLSMDLRGIVGLLLYMEGDGGIMNRSPQYIIEKAKRCLGHRHSYAYGLDDARQKRLQEWKKRWTPEVSTPKYWSDGKDDYRK